MKTKKNVIIGSILLVILALVAYKFIKGEDVVVMEVKTVNAKKANVTTLVTATGTRKNIC